MSPAPRITPEHARGIEFVGHSDLGGRCDGVQVMVNKGFAFVGHPFSDGGATIVDVRDPRHPRPVKTLPVHPRSWTLHLQTHGDLLLAAEEFNFIGARREGYAESGFGIRGKDYSAGLRVYDIANPAQPREIAFLQVEGLGLHRVWWAGERFAYASAVMDGFTDHMLISIDMKNPSQPREVGRWWLPGMWKGGGETHAWTGRMALHHAVVANDVAYCAWRDAGVILLDVSDPAAPRFISRRNSSAPFAGGTHTALPLPGRELVVVADEAMADISVEPQKHIWMLDVRAPSNPVSIATFPLPAEQDYIAKGGQFGPHNLWENRPEGLVSEQLIFATHQSAGVRVFNIENQLRPEEIAYFVPPPPQQMLDPRPGVKPVLHSADVYVNGDGLAYVTDYNAGFYVLDCTFL